jgi:hypothetical protein
MPSSVSSIPAQSRQHDKDKRPAFVKYCTNFENRLHLLRYFVVGCLIATTIICGYALLLRLESKLERSQYDSLADQLSASAIESLTAKVLSLKSMSTTVGGFCPQQSQWPNCSIDMPEFLDMADPIIDVAKMRAIAFAPIISPSQLPEFEAFAYEFLQEDGYDYLGVFDFGRGVYSVNSTLNASTGEPVGRYHDVTGHGGGGPAPPRLCSRAVRWR